MHAIDVIDGGFLTTVQDLGRHGYQRYGVPVSGAMDSFALRAANLLVGNPPSAAALEMTLHGPTLMFVRDTVLAICGADFEARLDDEPLVPWRAVPVPAGGRLRCGAARDGLRGYLACAGGVDVPLVLGSRSTFVRGNLGGLDGRALRRGDNLTLGPHSDIVEARSCAAEWIPRYDHDHTIRVVMGPQDDAFTEAGLAIFLSSTYVVSPRSDRIGWRLEGPRVLHRAGPDIISDGAPLGGVQFAGDGQPIVLAADRGTTGGYAKIATVISDDLSRLAQSQPGDRVGFRAVSVAEAQRARRGPEGGDPGTVVTG